MATKFITSLNDIMLEWADKQGVTEIDLEKAAEYAIQTKQYQRQPKSIKKQCMEDMARALSQQHHLDPQGRKIRTRKPFKMDYIGEQLTLWVDVRYAKPPIAQKVYEQDHAAIGNDVKRHSIETQSYNDNNPFGAKLSEFDYDYNYVAEEARVTGQYDDSFDDEDFNFDE